MKPVLGIQLGIWGSSISC